ncbi:pseudouridine synthase [Sphingobium sp.]|uniref:pseudouridine synthase n=1 Tax=Sphingobium TaxID=165695 RepID=UPI00257E8759|nr:pseudouridine synthase [Sphingobium sp.]
MEPPKKSGPPRRAGPGGPKRPAGPGRSGSGGRPGAPGRGAAPRQDQRRQGEGKPTAGPRADASPRVNKADDSRGDRPRSDRGGDRVRPDRARADGTGARAAADKPRAPRSEGERIDRPRTERSRPDRARGDAPPRFAAKSYPPRKPKGLGQTQTANPHPARAAAASDGKGEPQRIAKLLARAGVASRREIERMIEEGRVSKDGVVIDTPATLLTSLHGVTVDEVAIAAPAPMRLFLFHKPTGFLTTERDPAGRPTIYDRLPPDLPRLMPIGRLDMNTEGLLLMTTDGGFKREMELPATGVPRTYRARAFGEVSQQQLEDLFDGLEIDGIRYGAIEANLERRTGRNQWIEMTLTEGKNREVRRVLEHLDLKVNRLIRTSYGPFHLGELPVGAVEEVRQHDLVLFRKSLKAMV